MTGPWKGAFQNMYCCWSGRNYPWIYTWLDFHKLLIKCKDIYDHHLCRYGRTISVVWDGFCLSWASPKVRWLKCLRVKSVPSTLAKMADARFYSSRKSKIKLHFNEETITTLSQSAQSTFASTIYIKFISLAILHPALESNSRLRTGTTPLQIASHNAFVFHSASSHDRKSTVQRNIASLSTLSTTFSHIFHTQEIIDPIPCRDASILCFAITIVSARSQKAKGPSHLHRSGSQRPQAQQTTCSTSTSSR